MLGGWAGDHRPLLLLCPRSRTLAGGGGWARTMELTSWPGATLASVLGAEKLPGGDANARGYKDGLPVHTDALHPPTPYFPGHQLVTSPELHCCASHTTISQPLLPDPRSPVFSNGSCFLSHVTVQPATCTDGTAQALGGQALPGYAAKLGQSWGRCGSWLCAQSLFKQGTQSEGL